MNASHLFARTAAHLYDATRSLFFADEFAHRQGLLQSLDPRTKILGLGLLLLVTSSIKHNLPTLAGLFVAGVLLAKLSHIPIRLLAVRAWLPVLSLAVFLALPLLLSTAGKPFITLPFGLAVSWQGVQHALSLLLRVEAAATLSSLLILSTPWMHLLKGLHLLGVPAALVLLLSMTGRYIVLFLETTRDMFVARESRCVGTLSGPEQRRIAAASIGVVLLKTMSLSEEVYLAMRSRGFHGQAAILATFHFSRRDGVFLVLFTLAAVCCALRDLP